MILVNNKENLPLKRTLGRVEIVALIFGTMIGWSWIVLTSSWLNKGGLIGSIIALILCGIMCIFVGLIYAELTSAMPFAGGELVFAQRSMGFLGGYILSWIIVLAYISVAAWEGIAISTSISALLHIPKVGYLWSVSQYNVYFSRAIIGIFVAAVLTLLNVIGIKSAAIFQMLLVVFMILTGILFTLGGLAFGDLSASTKLFTNIKGVGLVLVMLPSMFIGFDMIAKSGEEIMAPLKSLPKIIVFSIVAAFIWYLLIMIGVFTSISDAASNHMVFTLATYTFGSPLIGKILILGAICGIITSWNGFIIGASRMLFAMGRAQMLPSFFTKIHDKYQSPYTAILFVGILTAIPSLLGEPVFVGLVKIAAFASVVVYFMVSISFLKLRKCDPNLNRPYKVKHGLLIGGFSVGMSGLLLLCYLPFSPIHLSLKEIFFPFIWMLLGSVLYMGRKKWAHRK